MSAAKIKITPIKRILVANRGEIACRIFRTAKAQGYETVAVYSEADAGARHTGMADRAAFIGPAPAAESYLSADKIIAAAKENGADAIHPGYGFLSENADFARACNDAGLVFVGPDADAIELMGNKATAKRCMLEAGVPCVPGYQAEEQSDAVLVSAANDIGYPIMVKAAAGGGGRGMRLVADRDALTGALGAARSEALNAFGSDELILEKAITNPRHVEIQVFGDNAGTIIHMGERDCSVQRRHQKVVEEAPCPVMTDMLRAEMGEAAVNAAKAVAYVGAGTVEFLLDGNGDFYFLEMNTRLQVEHPVTEMVTGLDLVALQLSVAEGRPLGLAQTDIALNGHAIEVRLYAEDPAADFLPVAGPVRLWQPPADARCDSGIMDGQQVSPFYDPMLAKIVVHGSSREEARLGLIKALEETVLFGIQSNLAFLIACLRTDSFARGDANTGFIAENFGHERLQVDTPGPEELAVAAVLDYCLRAEQASAAACGVSSVLQNWSSAAALTVPVCYQFGGATIDLEVRPLSRNEYIVACGEDTVRVSVDALADNQVKLHVGGVAKTFVYCCSADGLLHLAFGGRSFAFANQIYTVAGAGAADTKESGIISAPMHGMLLAVRAGVGATVKAGGTLAVLEAMKMQHQITASVSGTVEAVHIAEGSQVAAEQILFEIKESGAEA